MFHGRTLNNKINHLHERSIRIVYKENKSSFKELLKKENSFTVHLRNIQSLSTELFKVKVNLSNTIMGDILQTRARPYNLRSNTDFARISVNTSRFGLNSLRYFASEVWNIVPSDIKNASYLNIFKNKIRKWEPKEYHCYLCQPYVSNLRFVNLVEISVL